MIFIFLFTSLKPSWKIDSQDSAIVGLMVAMSVSSISDALNERYGKRKNFLIQYGHALSKALIGVALIKEIVLELPILWKAE